MFNEVTCLTEHVNFRNIGDLGDPKHQQPLLTPQRAELNRIFGLHCFMRHPGILHSTGNIYTAVLSKAKYPLLQDPLRPQKDALPPELPDAQADDARAPHKALLSMPGLL